jgi:hypothetical protein
MAQVGLIDREKRAEYNRKCFHSRYGKGPAILGLKVAVPVESVRREVSNENAAREVKGVPRTIQTWTERGRRSWEVSTRNAVKPSLMPDA